jgi:hypothetical protein
MKKPNLRLGSVLRNAGLGRFQDFSLLDAGGADAKTRRFSFHARADVLQVGKPSAPRSVVRVADVIAANRPFPANIANFSHYNL